MKNFLTRFKNFFYAKFMLAKGKSRNVLLSIFNVIANAMYKVFGAIFGGYRSKFVIAMLNALKDNEVSFAFSSIPIKPAEWPKFVYEDEEISNCAIVIQGPIRSEQNYTYETIRLYKKLYPNAKIILSTWVTESKEQLDLMDTIEGIYIVTSEVPDNPGAGNINMQKTSSLAGIMKASELGVKYVAKTRTDQRICKSGALSYLMNLMDIFPAESDSIQDKRLVALGGYYGTIFYPYFVADFFYFGTVQEMQRLFRFELNEPFTGDDDVASYTKREKVSHQLVTESYIMKTYLMKCGCVGDDSIEDYWAGVKKYLICTDIKILDLQWPKYGDDVELSRFYGDFNMRDSEDMLRTANFDFVNWLNLYSGRLVYKPEYEEYADKVYN